MDCLRHWHLHRRRRPHRAALTWLQQRAAGRQADRARAQGLFIRIAKARLTLS